MKHLRIFAVAVVIGFVASAIETVSGGAANSVASHQRGNVRLAYPVAFLYLAPDQSDARVTFELIDTNDYKGADTLTASVWGPFGRFVRSLVVPDDGISTAARKRTGPRRFSVEFTADSPGIYEIRMQGTPDLRVRPVLSSPKRGTRTGRLALRARRIFWMTPPQRLYAFAPAPATVRIAVMAFHRQPIRILAFDAKGERLASLERSADAPTAAAEFSAREQQLFELRLSGETFRMELAGVEPILCFTAEDARAFHRARTHQSKAVIERAVSQKPDSRALDAVHCGQDDSERAHEMTERASTPVKRLGRFGRKARAGFFAYPMRVSGDQRNYVTFALDGTEVGTIPWREAWPGLRIVRRRFRLRCNDTLLDQPIGADVPLPLSPSPALYLTYPIPPDLTADKTRVRIAIESVGESETATVFGIWTHTDPTWLPARQDLKPPAPVRQNATVNLKRILGTLLRRFDGAVETLKQCQWFGPEWERLVARQPEQKKFTGAFYSRPWRAPRAGRRIDPDWAGRSAQLYSRLWMAWATDSLAWAYLPEDSRHHGDEELLRRVLASADFLCRAQTATGGLEIERGNWRGGPNRKPGGGCHEGFAFWPPCSALLRVFDDIARTGAFEEMIDSDGDNKPDAPRRQAYARLLENWAARVIGDPVHARGHAPNQDVGDFLALALANELHSRLTGQPVVRPDQLFAYRDELFGARPSAYLVLSGDWANRFGSRQWFTPGGLLLEGRRGYYGGNPRAHGAGYDGGYGELTLFLLGEYARLGDRGIVARRLRKFMDAYQYFIDPARFDRGICLSHGLEWATARRTRHARGANLNAGVYVRAALLGSEPAKRLLQIWLQRFEDENITEWDDCFYGDHIKAINQLIPLVELIRAWLDRAIGRIDFRQVLPEEIRTAYRLPMERESFVWAEPTARRVVAKSGERRLYVAFDWDRRGVVPLAKYHRYDRLRDFIGEVAQAEDRGLLAARLPGFIVLLNCSGQVRVATLPWLAQTGARALAQAALNNDGSVNVAPRTAIVIESFPSGARAR